MRTLLDLDPKGKRVLVRVDYNVPVQDGKVQDETRILESLPTLRHLLAGGLPSSSSPTWAAPRARTPSTPWPRWGRP